MGCFSLFSLICRYMLGFLQAFLFLFFFLFFLKTIFLSWSILSIFLQKLDNPVFEPMVFILLIRFLLIESIQKIEAFEVMSVQNNRYSIFKKLNSSKKILNTQELIYSFVNLVNFLARRPFGFYR